MIGAVAVLSPNLAAPAAELRFQRVGTDRMEPVIHRGDFALVAAIEGWRGEGDYLVTVAGERAIYSFAADGTRAAPIRQFSPNRLYPHEQRLTRADFEARVVGKVVATLDVKDHALLRAFAPSI